MSEKVIHVVAGVIVRDGLFFVAKRNPGGPAGGKWEFPGGKVEANELPTAALTRELKEELGLDVTVGVSIGCFETVVAGRIIALDCYWVSASGGEIQLASHSEFKWVQLDELASLDFAAPDLPVVERIFAAPNAVAG